MPVTTFLFDLDGTLIDTDALHHQAFNSILARWDRHVDAAYYKSHIMGFPNSLIFDHLFPGMPPEQYQPLAEEKETLFRAQLGGHVEPVAGIGALLDHVHRIGGRCAVVTNAPRANAELMLRAGGLEGRFDALVIGDELARGKPDPLPYLTALQLLGARAEDAVAFEDSASGVKAASAAGLFTFGMLTGLDEAALKAAGARVAIPDFTAPVLWERIGAAG